MSKQKKSLKGLTLIEVMLGAVILVMVLVSIVSVYITCIELVVTSRNMTFAVNAAQIKMEELRDNNFYKIYTDYNNQTFTVTEMPAGASKGVIYVDNSDPDILKVTVSVCWQDRRRVVGEDLSLDGVLNGGEDRNSNGIIDSVVQIVSLITAR